MARAEHFVLFLVLDETKINLVDLKRAIDGRVKKKSACFLATGLLQLLTKSSIKISIGLAHEVAT